MPPALTVPHPSPISPTVWTVVGQTAQLTAHAAIGNDAPQDVTTAVSWTALNAGIATISPTGLLSAASSGLTPIRAIYEGRTLNTFLMVFRSPVTTVESFNGVMELRQRRRYFVTAGGDGVGFALNTSGPGAGDVGIMFGTAEAFTCRPPYSYGGNAFHSVSNSTGRFAHVQLAFRSAAAGRYCIIVLDPGTITPDDQLPSVIQPTPMTVPVNYTLAVGVTGTGMSIIAGP